MRFLNKYSWALGFLSTLVVAAPAPQATATATSSASNPSSSSNPCAIIAQQALKQQPPYSFQPSQVYACLQDVPFASVLASNLTGYIQTIVQFQTTPAYLKNPPANYSWPAYDLDAELNTILGKAQSGAYVNEWAFEMDLSNTLFGVHDGHYHVYPVLTTGLFWTSRPALVSISTDGTAIPQTYVRNDINSTGFTPSPITQINGENVDDVILAQSWLFQDKDATYNAALYNPATALYGGYGFSGWFGKSYTDYNDTIVFTFANGTTSSVPVTAHSAQTGISDLASGMDIYFHYILTQDTYQYCNSADGRATCLSYFSAPPSNSKRHVEPLDNFERRQASPTTSTTPSVASPTVGGESGLAASASSILAQIGLPTPVAASTAYEIAGYYLEDQPNTAVLYISSFAAQNAVSFQSALRDFLADCKTTNKTKLIIDVRGNGGGLTALAYDTFKQIFPQEEIFMRLRIRASSAANDLGTIITQLPDFDQFYANFIQSTSNVPSRSIQSAYDAVLSVFDDGTLLKENGQPFASWSDFFGPLQVNGDNFTNYYQWDYSDVLYDQVTSGGEDQESPGITITGYGDLSSLTAPAFASSNVTYITDGACGSSCGIFSNLLVRFGNVSTVAFGGQPTNNTMALIGGTQGAQVQGQANLVNWASGVYNYASQYGLQVTQSILDTLLSLITVPRINLGSALEINFVDNMAPGTSDTPLQFERREADCRMFYTASDINNIQSTWSKISSGNYTCIDGGTKPGTPKAKSAGVRSMVSEVGMALAIMTTLGFLII
jgi:hypothetical protein